MPLSTLRSIPTEYHLGIFLGGIFGGVLLGWLARGRQMNTLKKLTSSSSLASKAETTGGLRKQSSPIDLLEWTDTSEEGATDTDDEKQKPKNSHSKTRAKSRLPRKECKMVLLVRTDLDMGKGKMAAQCCHAAVGAYEEAVRRRDNHLITWRRFGQAKVALKVPSEDVLLSLAQTAKDAGMTTYVVRDAGRTQIAAGSVTVAAVGPAEVDRIDKITGHLKLL